MCPPEKTWRVLVTSPVPSVALEKLRTTPGLILDEYTGPLPMPTSEIQSRLSSTKHQALLITLIDKIDGTTLSKAKDHLKVISSMSVGYNHVDIGVCKEYGVKVGNTPGVLTESVADCVLLVALGACRRAWEAIRAVRDGEWGVWKAEWLCGVDVHGSTVGIVGLGRIGMAVARRFVGFGCKILYTDEREMEYGKKLGFVFVDGLEALVKEADIVVPLCPLTESTRGMFDMRVFKMMKRKSVLVNCSRGEVVNQEDLYTALKEKVIYAAGMDVTTPEPLPTNHKLLTLDNCFVLPHIASATQDTRNAMAELAADNLINAFHSKPMKTPVV